MHSTDTDIKNVIGLLVKRRDYLAQRIQAKKNVNYDTGYDEQEHWALNIAINVLQKSAETKDENEYTS